MEFQAIGSGEKLTLEDLPAGAKVREAKEKLAANAKVKVAACRVNLMRVEGGDPLGDDEPICPEGQEGDAQPLIYELRNPEPHHLLPTTATSASITGCPPGNCLHCGTRLPKSATVLDCGHIICNNCLEERPRELAEECLTEGLVSFTDSPDYLLCPFCLVATRKTTYLVERDNASNEQSRVAVKRFDPSLTAHDLIRKKITCAKCKKAPAAFTCGNEEFCRPRPMCEACFEEHAAGNPEEHPANPIDMGSIGYSTCHKKGHQQQRKVCMNQRVYACSVCLNDHSHDGCITQHKDLTDPELVSEGNRIFDERDRNLVAMQNEAKFRTEQVQSRLFSCQDKYQAQLQHCEERRSYLRTKVDEEERKALKVIEDLTASVKAQAKARREAIDELHGRLVAELTTRRDDTVLALSAHNSQVQEIVCERARVLSELHEVCREGVVQLAARDANLEFEECGERIVFGKQHAFPQVADEAAWKESGVHFKEEDKWIAGLVNFAVDDAKKNVTVNFTALDGGDFSTSVDDDVTGSFAPISHSWGDLY